MTPRKQNPEFSQRNPKFLTQFTGIWRLQRAIRHADGTEAKFDGAAEFTPSGTGLDYEERGLLTMPGTPPMQAVRRYRWSQDGDMIAVDFGDGRPFHSFDPAHPEAIHDCPPDHYQVRYDFTGWPRWQAIWQVSGPHKDYRMISTYSRS